MADFLLVFEEIPSITKDDIDKGSIPLEIYKLCSSIRVTFCLSYSIRKKNNLYLLFYKNRTLIKFQGDKLKFLGADERSQAILLIKAMYKTISITNGWNRSTPGIFTRKVESLLTPQNIFESLNHKIILILENNINTIQVLSIEELKSFRDLNDYLFIIPNFHKRSKVANFFDLEKILNNNKFVILPTIKNNADKILYINFLIDHQTEL